MKGSTLQRLFVCNTYLIFYFWGVFTLYILVFMAELYDLKGRDPDGACGAWNFPFWVINISGIFYCRLCVK